MADAVSSTASIGALPAAAAPEPTEATEPSTTDEATKVNGESGVTKEDEQIAGPQATTEVTAPDGNGTTEVAIGPTPVASDAAQTPAKKEKRKSVGGVPEHKSKSSKKKAQPTLHLDCKPGDHYWARLKGYPPWPAIICDEQMLPESLLGTRPVSATRPDGSIRDDFKEGGKNAKERTFPVMFLATNEFSWMVNTALTPLDPEETKAPVPGRMKGLKEAYDIAAEQHDLDYYKGLLKEFEKETQEMMENEQKRLEELAQAQAQKLAKESADEQRKKEKKASKSRVSKGGEDVDMEDTEAPKSSKKRKKTAETDEEQPKKTPKITKLNAPKTPNGEAAASASTKKSSTKAKKKVTAPKEQEQVLQMSEEEKRQMREKAILFLRHKLQKGFLARDKAPAEEEMQQMAEYFVQLESYDALEPAIIRVTKIHKVLKAIVKLASIPKEEEYHFKDRSHALLDVWNKRMEEDGGVAPKSAVTEEPPSAIETKASTTPITNGEKAADDKQAVKDEQEADNKEAETTVERETDSVAKEIDAKVAGDGETDVQAAKDDKPTDSIKETTAEGGDGDGDVSMEATAEATV